MTIDEISDNFALLDDWDDRYRYIIELGRTLAPLPAEAHTDANKVQGRASQVWLTTSAQPDGSGGPVLTFQGDSDAHIVRGLIAILFAIYSGKTADDVLGTDGQAIFAELGLKEHLTRARTGSPLWSIRITPGVARGVRKIPHQRRRAAGTQEASGLSRHDAQARELLGVRGHLARAKGAHGRHRGGGVGGPVAGNDVVLFDARGAPDVVDLPISNATLKLS